LVTEYNTGDQVCLSLGVDEVTGNIIYTSLNKAHRLTLGKDFSIHPVKSIDLFSTKDVRRIKCSLDSDLVAISDDTPRVCIYDARKLTLLRKIRVQTSVVDVYLKTHLLIVEERKLTVFDVRSGRCFTRTLDERNVTYRIGRIKNNIIYLLLSGKKGPSIIMKLDLSGRAIKSHIVSLKPVNSMEINTIGDKDVISVCIGEGVIVYDTNFNILLTKNNLHGIATSCSDVYLDSKLNVISGGLDKSVSYMSEFPPSSYLKWTILVVILLYNGFILWKMFRLRSQFSSLILIPSPTSK
jgi:hypothetical protein